MCELAIELGMYWRYMTCVEERVLETCQGGVQTLSCPSGSLIRLRTIHLVDSRCLGSSNCCPRSNDCSAPASTGQCSCLRLHFAPVRSRSIVMSMSVCVFVSRLSARLT